MQEGRCPSLSWRGPSRGESGVTMEDLLDRGEMGRDSPGEEGSDVSQGGSALSFHKGHVEQLGFHRQHRG